MADQNAKPTVSSAKSEIGVSGTLIYNGIITGEEYNRNLTGALGNHKYEIMRRSDATIRSTLQMVKLPLLSTTWQVEPPKQRDGSILPADQKKADHLNRELFDRNINFYDFLKNALTSFDFGFSIFEKVFETSEYEGQLLWGLKKLASRKQISVYKWEISGGKPGVTQMIGGKTCEIPWEKLVHFSYDQEGENWAGTSLLRYVYKDWDLKDKLTLVNAIALEKHGIGIPIAQAKQGATPTAEDETDVTRVLSNLRANEKSYMKVPRTYEISMLDMKAGSTKEIIPTLKYHDSRIAAAILARFLELGGDSGSGSQSLSKDLSSLFMKSEEAVAREFAASVEQYIIKPLCDMNYADNSSGYPKLIFGAIGDDDNIALAEALATLMNAGAVTADPEIEDTLRDRFRLPEMSKEMRKAYEDRIKEGNIDNPKKDPGTNTDIPPTDKSVKDKKPTDIEAALKAAAESRSNLLAVLQEA